MPSFPRLLPLAVAACFLDISLAHAQGAPAARDEATLGTVVVTATRIPTRINELASDVTVVDREQIERGGATLREVFRSIPGMEITQTGGQGNALSVFMRGTNSDHVLVLVDGMRLGSATLGTTAFENIPLDNIERIEVVRGPASSLYGSSAIGGVIQIFTRSGRGDPGMNFSAGYGSYNTARVSVGTGHEKDGLRYALQAGATYTDGFTAITNPRSTSYNPDADGYRNRNFSAQLAREFGPDSEVGVKLMQSDGLAHFDSTPLPASDFRTYSSLAAYTLHGSRRIGERWTTRLSYGNSVDDSTTYSSASLSTVLRTTQDQLVWQNDITLPVGTLMLAAENLQQNVRGSTNFPVTSRDVNTAAAAYQANLGAHHLQVSARQDRYDQFGVKNTGYGGYGFELAPRWRVTAGTGTAFKAPSFNQLYFPGFGNPNLLPESARNSEAGLKYDGPRAQFGVVYFHNIVSNLIVNAGPPTALTPQNVGKARITGTTITGAVQAYETQFTGNLNFQDPRDATNNLLLVRRAKRFMNLGASRPFEGGRLGLEMFSTDARYNDAANLFRMGGYTLFSAYYDHPINKQWTWHTRGDNLGNKRYESAQSNNLPFSFNVPGTTVFVGVRYQER